MMMPPRTVARFQCDLLNLNQAGPRAAGKSELTNRTGNSVLKAKHKYRARHGYAEADCYFPFPFHLLCSFLVEICLHAETRNFDAVHTRCNVIRIADTAKPAW